MQLITCRNGHRYDPSLTSECPECAMFNSGVTLDEGTIDLNGGYSPIDNIGETLDLQRDGGSTIPLVDPRVSQKPQRTEPTAPAEEYGVTMAVSSSGAFIAKSEQKTTGWLVCIDGPEKGKDYRLHNDNNYIGRSTRNDVSIPSDNTVSSEKHCVVTYDREDRLFYVGLSGGASIVRLNGKPVLMTQEIKSGDRLKIGQGTFLFVPLCGENFEWEE